MLCTVGLRLVGGVSDDAAIRRSGPIYLVVSSASTPGANVAARLVKEV